MKTIILILALVVGCGSRPADNLAVRQMKLVDPAATCDPWFTDVGDQHVHTAACTNSARDIVYVRVEVGKQLAAPQMLIPGPAALAKAQEDAQHAKPAPPSSPPATPPAQPEAITP